MKVPNTLRLTVILSEMLRPKKWLYSSSHHLWSSNLIYLPKLPHLRCFLIFVTSWACWMSILQL